MSYDKNSLDSVVSDVFSSVVGVIVPLKLELRSHRGTVYESFQKPILDRFTWMPVETIEMFVLSSNLR